MKAFAVVALMGALVVATAAARGYIEQEGNTVLVVAEDAGGSEDVELRAGSDTITVKTLLQRLADMDSTMVANAEAAASATVATQQDFTAQLSQARSTVVSVQQDLSTTKSTLAATQSDLDSEISLARINEKALSDDYTGMLLQLNELTSSHSNLDGAHNNTFDLVKTLVQSLSTESSRAVAAEGLERARAIAAEQGLSTDFKAADSSMEVAMATDHSTIRTEIAASVSELRANPPSILPQGNLIGELAVQSAGYCNGNYLRVWKDGKVISFTQGRGVNCVYFNAALEQKTTGTYDTHRSADETKRLAADIAAAAFGDIIVCGVIDEATSSLSSGTFTEDGYQALESIGSHLIRQLQWRQSWAIIGQKGAAGGFLPEDIGAATNTDPDAASPDDCIGYYSRPTKILRRRFYDGPRGALANLSPYIERHVEELAILEDVRHHGNEEMHTIEAQSKGLCDGNVFLVWLDGQLVPNTPNGRGINVVAFSPFDLSVLAKGSFDTYGSASADDALANMVLAQPFGTIFALGVRDEASNQLSQVVREVLQQELGAHELDSLLFRESWVLIGRRGGDSAGLVVEDHGKADSGPVGGCGGGGRPTAKVGLRFLELAKGD